MTAQDHGKTIGTLFVVMGVLALIIYLIVIVACVVIGAAIIANERRFNNDAAGGLAIIIGGIVGGIVGIVIWGVTFLVAGLKLKKRAAGAKIWATIAAIVSLLYLFPLGTVVGIYALWFIFGEQGKNFFAASGATAPPPPPSGWQ